MERQLIEDYRATILSLLDSLNEGNIATAIKIAGLPEKVRGFGHVKQLAMADARTRQASLLTRFAMPASSAVRSA